jgi:hypothetical protein
MEASLASRRDPTMRANHSNSTGAGTVLLSIAAVALAGMVGTITLIHQVGELGPKVGDIIAFDPLESISSDMHARVPAMPADGKPGVACVLDVRTIHATGGSVIIEARDPQPGLGYRIHWAGRRSSDDGANCGASADLRVNLDDIEVLAMAAGGYGVPASKHSVPFMRPTAAAQ